MKVKFVKARFPQLLIKALDEAGDIEILHIGPDGSRYSAFYVEKPPKRKLKEKEKDVTHG